MSIFTGIFIKKTGLYQPLIWFGMVMMTLGFGLFINFGVNSPWSKIIVFQIIAGLGVGPNFQAPLIALQSLVPKRDIATATATFGFTRNLGSAISVVVGSVIFQNQMKSKQPQLAAVLGPERASAFGGGAAGANVGLIQGLPENQKLVARQAFSSSLSTMWILYVVFAALGLTVSLLITKNKLDKQHEETKTGLEAERLAKIDRDAERDARRKKRASKASLPMMDTEAQAEDAYATSEVQAGK
jgi:MFS family permease